MILTLPWPPSVNTYWRHPTRGALAGRHLISEDGRRYRSAVGAIIMSERHAVGLQSRLRVVIRACPPDARRRDLDNLPKGLLDAIQHAGVYADDSQIDDLRIVRGPVVPGGQVVVDIWPVEPSRAALSDF